MKKENIGSVKVIPLGGLEQIGMNITAIEYDDSIVVVDCGLSFPAEDMLGIDLVIPDVTYLKENLNRLKDSLLLMDMRIILVVLLSYYKMLIFQLFTLLKLHVI